MVSLEVHLSGTWQWELIFNCGLRIADCLQDPAGGLGPPKPSEGGLEIAECGLRIADCGLAEARRRRIVDSRIDRNIINNFPPLAGFFYSGLFTFQVTDKLKRKTTLPTSLGYSSSSLIHK
jgi:hypothetical protein